MKKLTWKPIRNGKTYCSPACGHGCKWEDYQTAIKESKAVARKLGPGWKPRVWENLGWHWTVNAQAGTYWLTVSGCSDKGMKQLYNCMISDLQGAGSPGLYDTVFYGTPTTAVAASVAVFLEATKAYQEAGLKMFLLMAPHCKLLKKK